MHCPTCHKENPTGSRFCQFCGSQMGVAAEMKTAISSSVDEVQLRPPTSQAKPLKQAQVTTTSPGAAIPSRSIGQIGAGGLSPLHIWGPFAGQGTRGRHVSWLLDDLGENAQALHQAVSDRFQLRQVPGSNMNWKTLAAKGLIVERRPLYFIKRGITTVALYIARFGQDLYISQVTYVKGPISNVRVLIAVLMLLFALYTNFVYSAVLLDRLYSFNFLSSGSRFPFFLLCVIGPLGVLNEIALGLMFIFSMYKWIKEKDFFAILRMPPNEFQEDDTIALEKAVEETVRQSLDVIGIDTNLMPPTREEYGPRRRLI